MTDITEDDITAVADSLAADESDAVDGVFVDEPNGDPNPDPAAADEGGAQ